jgi:hypothetical protein
VTSAFTAKSKRIIKYLIKQKHHDDCFLGHEEYHSDRLPTGWMVVVTVVIVVIMWHIDPLLGEDLETDNKTTALAW